MVEFSTYILLFGISLILASVFVFYRRDRDETFVRLSMLFIILFYIIPLYMLFFTNGFFYGLTSVHFDSPGVLKATVSVCLFVLGFFLTDLVEVARRNDSSNIFKAEVRGSLEINKKTVFLIFFAGVIVFTIYRWLAPTSEDLYSIRKGVAEGSHLVFFLSIVATSLMISSFFLCVGAGWRFLAAICMALILLGYLLASPGRTTLSLTFILAFIFIFRISPRTLVTWLPAAILVLFPIIINGKEIIYKLVVSNEYFHIADLYSFGSLDGHKIFSNLAHPLVSMIYSDKLLSIAGQRFFYDYIQGFLFYLRVFGLDTGDSLTYFNTKSILGINESVVPPGYIAFGYAQFLYVGVVVSGLFYRMTFRIFSASSMYKLADGREMVFYASFISANTFYTGDIRQLVLSFFLVILVMHLVGNLAIKKPSPEF